MTRIVIATAVGPIIAAIHTERAPLTAANFLRYVDGGWYRDATFYRALRPENCGQTTGLRVIQGGIDSSCRHPPLPPIAHETTRATGLTHTDGAISLARWEPGTGASEFFIVVGEAPELDWGGRYDEGYAVFGHVVEGLEVVRQINSMSTDEATSIEYMKGQALVPIRMQVTRRVDV